MASKQLFATLAIVAIVLPTVALATEYIVGDDRGWTNTGFDYQAWAKGKEFRVGDKLVFKYTKGEHNVYKVDGAGFANCTVTPDNEVLITGNDVIPLAKTGKKWYICGVGKHCELGAQKLSITVLPELLAAPSPSPTNPETPNSAYGISSGYHVLIATVIAIAMIFV